MKTLTRLLPGLLLLPCAALRADVVLAPLFTDGAILQRDKPVAVWGRADAGEKVTVRFASQQQEATAGADGRWLVRLDALPATAQGTPLTVQGRNTVVVQDVLVGEVWLCSGQSNMEWPVARAADAEREIAGAAFPQLRHVRIEHTVAGSPADTVRTGGWQAATPQNVGTFTAVGYFFARDLHQRLKVPVGLVHSSWGGTPVESWLDAAVLAGNPAFQVVGERWRQMLAEFPARQAEYEAKLATWTKAEEEARRTLAPKAAAGNKKAAAKGAAPSTHAEWLARNPRPRPPRGPGDPWTPSGLFNGMIQPLLPYSLGGILWYQGESNAERASEYHALFTSLITSWRGHFGQGDLAFYWVNLANYAVAADAGEKGRSYAFLREAQTRALALPNTGQALAIDIGEAKDIHPRNKQEVGRRLALLARQRLFDIVGDDTGPTFVSATREGGSLRVRFTHAGGGLIARDKPVQSLEVAGADRVFHPAEGRIERDTLVVTAKAVREPVAVRYAWTNAPEANLHNGAGLPAVPFRSDTW